MTTRRAALAECPSPENRSEVAMQYLLLIYEGEDRFAKLTESAMKAELGEYQVR